MRTSLCALAVATVLSGCGLAPPAPMVDVKTTFFTSEHEVYRQEGSNVVSGQGFLRQKGGGVVTCAGSKVFLFPATSFFREIVGHYTAGRRVNPAEMIPPGYAGILKETSCDAQGNFSFAAVPSARWFVSTDVRWSVGYNQQGGLLIKEVVVSGNRVQSVLLSDSDLTAR